MVGGLFAFMMLSGRVAQPLVGLARLVQEYEEVNAAIGEAGAVLNRPLEIDAASGGLRPKCAISFQDVTFTYGGTGAATVNLAVEHGQGALDIGRVAGLDDTSRIKPLLPVVRLSLCPHCTSRPPLTMMSTWPWHMKGLEMRFVSALPRGAPPKPACPRADLHRPPAAAGCRRSRSDI